MGLGLDRALCLEFWRGSRPSGPADLGLWMFLSGQHRPMATLTSRAEIRDVEARKCIEIITCLDGLGCRRRPIVAPLGDLGCMSTHQGLQKRRRIPEHGPMCERLVHELCALSEVHESGTGTGTDEINSCVDYSALEV